MGVRGSSWEGKVGLEAIIVFLNPGEMKSVMPEENFCIRVTVGAKKVFF